jgi:N-acetyl-anhydromuramyl-L-alanine amidase AmpD
VPYTRKHPNVVIKRLSPNYSERTTTIGLIVLHDTESGQVPRSAKDLEGVASWFANPDSQVSAHVITDADGNSARCVPDRFKAWQCMAYNSAALGIEQVGFEGQPFARREYVETARWIAQWSHEHHIPIRRARTYRGMVIVSGIATHSSLGIYGGGHDDPGPTYPFKRTLEIAREIKKERY